MEGFAKAVKFLEFCLFFTFITTFLHSSISESLILCVHARVWCVCVCVCVGVCVCVCVCVESASNLQCLVEQ